MSKEDTKATRAENDMVAILNKAAADTQISAGWVVAILGMTTPADVRRELALAILPQFEEMAETYRLAVISLREAASIQ